MPKSVPIESRHAETSARGDYGAVSFFVFGAFIQSNEIFGVECVDSVGIGFEIIDQANRIELQLFGQFASVDGPRKIGDFAATSFSRVRRPQSMRFAPGCPLS